MSYKVTTLDDAKVLAEEIAIFADAVRGMSFLLLADAPDFNDHDTLAVCLRALGEGIGIRADSFIAGGQVMGDAAEWLLPPIIEERRQQR